MHCSLSERIVCPTSHGISFPPARWVPRCPWASLLCLLWLGLVPVASASDGERAFLWGGAAGFVGDVPLGTDVSSGDQDEYVPGLGLQLELFSVHWGQSLQMSPVVTVGLYGGLNDEQYRDALLGPDGAVDDVGISRASAGLRVRWLPLSYGALRPYLVAGASYLRSGVTYTPESVPGLPGDLSGAQGEATGVQAEQVAAGDVDGAQEDTSDSAVEGPPASGFPFGAPASVFRHEGAGLDFGLGVRWELQAGWFGERGILPVQLELLYTQGLWFGLERTDGAAGEGVLAPEDMSLNILALSLNVGYLR